MAAAESVIFEAMESAILSDLIALGHDNARVINALLDVNLRLEWRNQSECFIYSRSSNNWCNGQIVETIIEEKTNEEWLVVRYRKKKKRIQRFSAFLKPTSLGKDTLYDEAVIVQIVQRLKTALVTTV